jgi:hypothetical protein
MRFAVIPNTVGHGAFVRCGVIFQIRHSKSWYFIFDLPIALMSFPPLIGYFIDIQET